MIRAIIFDLDNCLVSPLEAGRALFEPALTAMALHNRGALSPEELERAFDDCFRDPFDVVVARYSFPEPMARAGFRAFEALEVRGPLYGYGDLDVLPGLKVTRYLVTSGFERLQHSKIRALGIAHHFAAVHIDKLTYGAPRRGKERIFVELTREAGLAPHEVLVVGDSAESELAAGARLGMPTVQSLREGVPFWPSATHHVKNLHELSAWLNEQR
jgi:FMN phosphatase YigB (HAD superfamily)